MRYAFRLLDHNSGAANREMLMNVKCRMCLLLGVAALAAAMSMAKVKTDYDRSAEFTRFKTYSWEAVHTENPLYVDRIKAAVDSALKAKGWAKVDDGGDVSIMAMGMTKDRRTIRTYYDTYGGGWSWRSGGGFGGDFGSATTTEETYTVGTLVVDLFDTSTKKLIWRGSASKTLSDKSEQNIKIIARDVQKMFDRFPADTRKTQE
jgi:hypothetical protein